MESVKLLSLNLATEPDLQNFVCFLMESAKRLKGNIFKASLASLELGLRLRAAGACSGQPFAVSLQLKDNKLLTIWEKTELATVQVGEVKKHEIEQLRDHLRKSTEIIVPEILMQRNEAMVRHLNETRVRTEHELAKLEEQLIARQAALQASIHQAETDPLTGLLNRRAFDEKLNKAFRHTMRQKNAPLTLMILDLDFFKSINDLHGHQYGDNYLIKMAKVMRSEIRENVDSAFRFGGDEFAMVIYSDYFNACNKAQHVIQQMDSRVSIGIATIDQHTRNDLTLEEFIHQADNALYDAKHQGRGRAVVAQCEMNNTQDCNVACNKDNYYV